MKQFITRRSFIKAAGAATALTAVSVGAPAAFAEETNCFFGDKADVTILYTNDVHTYIDNKSPKPTYAAIAALKKSIEDTGRDVLLVDAGDHIQGTAYGSMDDGATIIELMNEAGYDLATPGNHEFDYGNALFGELGMNLSTAFNIFVRQSLRDGGIPFEISLNQPNKETIAAMLEAERIAKDPSVKGYTNTDELFADLKA